VEQGSLNWIANFIWGIADDVLRDLYVRGKYRDVILPMTVLRRLDAVLEPTKPAVLAMKAKLDKAGITNQDQALRQAAGQAFYNTSKFTLRDLKSRASQQALKSDFEAYLDGFSPSVQEILENFEFRNQIAAPRYIINFPTKRQAVQRQRVLPALAHRHRVLAHLRVTARAPARAGTSVGASGRCGPAVARDPRRAAVSQPSTSATVKSRAPRARASRSRAGVKPARLKIAISTRVGGRSRS
jgi:hypothetical protein